MYISVPSPYLQNHVSGKVGSGLLSPGGNVRDLCSIHACVMAYVHVCTCMCHSVGLEIDHHLSMFASSQMQP